MSKRIAFAFAVVGYLIALWYYAAAFAPVTWTAGRAVLWYGCVACVNVSGLHSSRLLSAIVFIGPMNALVYAAAGYVLGMGVTLLPGKNRRAARRAGIVRRATDG
jgi:hypothetical protein